MLVDILEEAYQSKSSDQNQAMLFNMYLEEDTHKGKYKVIALPTAGLTLFSDTSQSSVRELYSLNNVLYGIAGNILYRINSDATLTTLGTISTTTGFAKLRAITGSSDNNNQLFMIDGTAGYSYNLGTASFATIGTNTFIQSIQIITSGTGYVSPTVSITDGSGTGATASATVSSGVITGISVDTAGTGYSNTPTVTITDSTGTGATANAIVATNNFPATAVDIENQDDYVLAVLNNSIQFQISNVSDTTTWDPLNFTSKTGQPDQINAILSHEGKIWLFGTKCTEVWEDSGTTQNQFFPFTRDNNVFLHYGCPARRSIAVNGNYFIFLSSNGKGDYSVLQTQPRIYYYNPSPVSNPYIDTLMGSYSIISDGIGNIYNKDGHEFYELTFPTANSTIVYDIPKAQQADQAKGHWFFRSSYVNGTYGRFLGNCQAYAYGKNFVGDFNSGKIYYQDSSNYTENGTAIKRQFISPPGPTYQGGKRVFVNKLQIDIETGVGSNETFTLEKSIDNGANWALVNTYTIPSKGGRIYENRLGSTRYGMIFRLTTTMNAKFIILGFQAEANLGHS